MRLDDRRWAGLLLFGGIAQFAIGLTMAEALTPNYSVSGNYISDLGVRSAALIFNTSIVLLGLAVIVSGWFVLRAFKDLILTIAVVLAGIGAIGVGVLTEDFGGIHSIVSLITFVFAALSAILAFRILRPPLAYLSILLGAASLLALGLYISNTYLGLGPGGMERMIVWPVIVWGLAFGGYLLSDGTNPAVSPPTP